MHEFWRRRLELTIPIVERAVARGELPDDVDPILVVETVVSPLWLRLMLTGEPITTEVADRIADLVAGAAERGK